MTNPVRFVASQLSLPKALEKYSLVLILVDQKTNVEDSSVENTYQCVLCEDNKLKIDGIQEHVDFKCPRFRIECPGCKEMGDRQEIEGPHQMQCEFVTVECSLCSL